MICDEGAVPNLSKVERTEIHSISARASLAPSEQGWQNSVFSGATAAACSISNHSGGISEHLHLSNWRGCFGVLVQFSDCFTVCKCAGMRIYFVERSNFISQISFLLGRSAQTRH